MAGLGSRMAGPSMKVALLLICVGVTVLSWWHPFKLGGLGWLGAAFVGPFVAVLIVWFLLYPDPEDKFVLGHLPEREQSPGRLENLLGVLAVASGVIHGGVWTYVNIR